MAKFLGGYWDAGTLILSKEHRTVVSQEVIAGLPTFAAMAYHSGG
ncbi:MAG TPA: hypothetical protein VK775_00645 [Chthoniobacterales bacterium]|nr:hypothetical protein [Chthoniobacterales bacterium]